MPLQNTLERTAPPAEQPKREAPGQDSNGHLRREGSCVCGLAVLLHWDAENRFVGCFGAARRAAATSELLYDLPVTLDETHMARLFHRSVRWVRERIEAGAFPIPWIEKSAGVRLWSRAVVETWLERSTWDPATPEKVR